MVATLADTEQKTCAGLALRKNFPKRVAQKAKNQKLVITKLI
jgi:hypothetical protein